MDKEESELLLLLESQCEDLLTSIRNKYPDDFKDISKEEYKCQYIDAIRKTLDMLCNYRIDIILSSLVK